MRRTRIKICCIASEAEAELAIAAGADALGFVGPMPTGPGVIAPEAIRRIVASVPPPITSFLLTSGTTAEGIASEAEEAGVSTVQIVQHVDPSLLEALGRRMPALRRVQVIHVEDASAVDLVRAYEPYAHVFLLDSGRPGAMELGGTGRVHDWSISAAVVRATQRPVFLAGGLNAGNVADAMRQVGPFGLDLCTGVRTEGALDRDKLAAFVAAVRSADRTG